MLAGPYRVRAELVTANGLVYGSAEAPFRIGAGTASANATRITSDRAQYNLAQAIQLQSVVSNVSVNVLQEALSAETVVTDAQGREVFRASEDIAQLPANALRQYVYNLAAGSLPAGVYQARLSLFGSADYLKQLREISSPTLRRQANDVLLSESVTSFQVIAAATCAQGITGTLLPQPSAAAIGQPVALALTLDNPGTAAIQNATLRLRIVDANTGAVIEEQSLSAVDVTASGQWHHQWRWQAKGTAGQTLVAIATLEVSGCAEIVAHASITLGNGGPGPVVGVPLDARWPLTAMLVALAWHARRRRSEPSTVNQHFR